MSLALGTRKFLARRNKLRATRVITDHGSSQFGNMLVLSAVYNSYLRPLIDGNKVKGLLSRTIDFLGRNADISPSLRRDMQQLQKIESQLFPKINSLASVSFSSTEI